MTPMTGLTARESDRSSLSFVFIVVFYPPATDRVAFDADDDSAIITTEFDYAGALLRVERRST